MFHEYPLWRFVPTKGARAAKLVLCVQKTSAEVRETPTNMSGRSQTESGLHEQVSFESAFLGYQRCCCARAIRATTYMKTDECRRIGERYYRVIQLIRV